MGELIPHICLDVVPGDKFTFNLETMVRLAPMIAPLMHRVNVTTHLFFVPNRIIWTDWEKFISGDETIEWASTLINDEADYPIGLGSLGDYLQYPSRGEYKTQASVLPLAAYFKIFDEYYRDENLVSETFVEVFSSDDNEEYRIKASEPCLKRAWAHDYFTSALPFAQKGSPVLLPLLNDMEVDVKIKEVLTGLTQTLLNEDGTPWTGTNALQSVGGGNNWLASSGSPNKRYLDPNGTLFVDVNSEAVTINTLRRAIKLQEWLERNARGGTRYTELIMSHFGVRGSDARFQRPEYIGGYKQTLGISEVVGTSLTGLNESEETPYTPIGTLAGHAIAVADGFAEFYAEEHGYIIGIFNVQPVPEYMNGIHRHLTRKTFLDYYWPSFAHIGEQAILAKELFVEEDPVDQEVEWGYIPRYSEYKYWPSRVSGEFKGSLDFWHMARKFSNSSIPVLNDEFITANPTKRIFAVEDVEVNAVYVHHYTGCLAYRKMPVFGEPTL